MGRKFLGKFRGVVTNDHDPQQLGRVKASVPGVLGEGESAWAMPCAPASLPNRKGAGLPKVGANVWIEFENGDPAFPIWSGCFYGNASETPVALKN